MTDARIGAWVTLIDDRGRSYATGVVREVFADCVRVGEIREVCARRVRVGEVWWPARLARRATFWERLARRWTLKE